MPEQVSQQQRDAIKTAAKERRFQARLAKEAGIALPTLTIWLATGRGLGTKKVEDVLAAAESLLGIVIDRMPEIRQKASPVSPNCD